jgi:hypothetical protein
MLIQAGSLGLEKLALVDGEKQPVCFDLRASKRMLGDARSIDIPFVLSDVLPDGASFSPCNRE